jgi:hypothetical protein
MNEHGDDGARFNRRAVRKQFDPTHLVVPPLGQSDPGTLESFTAVSDHRARQISIEAWWRLPRNSNWIVREGQVSRLLEKPGNFVCGGTAE